MTDVLKPSKNDQDSAIVAAPISVIQDEHREGSVTELASQTGILSSTGVTVPQPSHIQPIVTLNGRTNPPLRKKSITGPLTIMSSELINTGSSTCECGKEWREFNMIDVTENSNPSRPLSTQNLIGDTSTIGDKECAKITSITTSPESAKRGKIIVQEFGRHQQHNNKEFGMVMKKIDLVQKYYEEKLKIRSREEMNANSTASLGRTSLQIDASSNSSRVPSQECSTSVSGKDKDSWARGAADYHNSYINENKNISNVLHVKECDQLKKIAMKEGMHILIPAPPPYWSGGGRQAPVASSTKLLQNISSTDFLSKRSPNSQMVTVVPSPYYTSKSARDAMKAYDYKICDKMPPKTVNSPRQSNINGTKGSRYGIPDPNEGSLKTVVVVADKERCAKEMSSGAGHISNNKNLQSKSTTDGSCKIANCSLILELSDKMDIDKVVYRNICNRGGAITNADNNNNEMKLSQSHNSNSMPLRTSDSFRSLSASQGYFGTVCMASTRIDGVTVRVTPRPPQDLNENTTLSDTNHSSRSLSKGQELSAIESTTVKGPALFISASAVEEYEKESLVSAAIKQTEIGNVSSQLSPNTNQKRSNISNSKCPPYTADDVSLDPSVSYKKETSESPGYVLGNIGVRIDLGRDRIMCSSPRFGHRGDDIYQLANDASRAIVFATDMAPSLVVDGPQLRQRANKAFGMDEKDHLLDTYDNTEVKLRVSPSTSRSPSGSPRRRISPKRGITSEVAFLTSSPRFSGDDSNLPFSRSNRKCPPVGHYNPRHSLVDNKLIRNVYLNGIIQYKEANKAQMQAIEIAKRNDMIKKEIDQKMNIDDRETEKSNNLDRTRGFGSTTNNFPTSSFASRCPRMSPDRKQEGHEGDIDNYSNNKTKGDSTAILGYNEAFISTSKRVMDGVDMSRGESRDKRPGWDHTSSKEYTSSEAHYTGPLRGDSTDARLKVKCLVQMDQTQGRGGGHHISNPNTIGMNSLDFCDNTVLDESHTSKYKKTLWNIPMAKQSDRKDYTVLANNVSSDTRASTLGVVYDGSDATKNTKPSASFARQLSRQSNVKKHCCSVETYDVVFDDGYGNVIEGLSNKNEIVSPRTAQVNFDRMGSHNDYSSFSAHQTRNKLADGLSGDEVTNAMKITRARNVKDVDFIKMSPRSNHIKALVDTCANPDNIYPKHLIEKDVSGIPRISLAVTREQREAQRSPRSAAITDVFYDYKISYDAEKCKKPQNRVNIVNSPGRTAGGSRVHMAGNSLGSPARSSSSPRRSCGNISTRGGSAQSPIRCEMTTGAELGPGSYDYNIKVLSKHPKKLK